MCEACHYHRPGDGCEQQPIIVSVNGALGKWEKHLYIIDGKKYDIEKWVYLAFN